MKCKFAFIFFGIINHFALNKLIAYNTTLRINFRRYPQQQKYFIIVFVVPVRPAMGDVAGESSSISTSMVGAEQVLLDASLDGVGGETKFGVTSASAIETGSICIGSEAGATLASVDVISENFS